jgi:DNA-binding MarR family transcriptional regulator
MADMQEPRSLYPDEQETWIAFAYLLVQLPGALDMNMQRASGIGLFEFQVLAALSLAPDRSTRLSRLADFTASSLSRLSNVMTRLEERGWVRRTVDPEDGRCTLGVLTDAGAEQVAAAMPKHIAEVRRLVFDPLTNAQQQQLRRIALRIMQAVEPDKPPLTERLRALGRTPFPEEAVQ